MRTFQIDGRTIGPGSPPYVIAEISGNHNGSIGRAKSLIAAAKDAGADAAKLQTYRGDTITIDATGPDFTIDEGLWKGRTLFELYNEAHTPWEWHQELFDEGKKLGITIFSSPFDFTAVDFLESLNAPAYKIASFEAVDLELISAVSRTGKPVIISTGMCQQEEIADAVAAAREAGAESIALLHCLSAYPAVEENFNLLTLVDLSSRFKCVTGLSDHTLGNTAAISAVSIGASIIEKHLTLRRADGGPDAAFSAEPNELKGLVDACKKAWQAVGAVQYGIRSGEQGYIRFRRSLYVVDSVKKGDELTRQNVRSIRPGLGLPPKHIGEVLGRRAARDIPRGTPLRWEMVE